MGELFINRDKSAYVSILDVNIELNYTIKPTTIIGFICLQNVNLYYKKYTKQNVNKIGCFPRANGHRHCRRITEKPVFSIKVKYKPNFHVYIVKSIVI